jgi:hypothetical protein
MKSKIDNENLKILTKKGWEVYPPRQTRIEESHDFTNVCVVREGYMGFKGSNVYALNEDLEIAWEAELPHSSDIFPNALIATNDGIETTTWNGVHCHIDILTGKVTKLDMKK